MTYAKYIGVFLCLGVLASCTHTRRLLMNPVVEVPSGASTRQVQKSIREAFTRYGWTVDREESGVTHAHLNKKRWGAEVRAEYDSRHVTIKHVSSKNMNYVKSANGEERVHSHYNTWARNIARNLAAQFSRLSE